MIKSYFLFGEELDIYAELMELICEYLEDGISISYRQLWYMLESMIISLPVNDSKEDDEIELDEDDELELKDYESMLSGDDKIDDKTKKAKTRAYKKYIEIVNTLCTLLDVTHLHLNIIKGARGRGYGKLLLIRDEEELELEVYDSNSKQWKTITLKRPRQMIDFSQSTGVDIDFAISKDMLCLDSKDVHFQQSPEHPTVKLLQCFEAQGPCELYINSGCAEENGALCINTRGTLVFYTSHFAVFAEKVLDVPIFFLSECFILLSCNLCANVLTILYYYIHIDDINVYGIGTIPTSINGSFIDWSKVDDKAVYKRRNGTVINVPECRLLMDTNYFLLLGPDDIEDIMKQHTHIKEKKMEWNSRHSSIITGLLDTKKSMFCTKGMALCRPSFLRKFKKMKLNIQLESFGSRLIVGIINKRHQSIVREEVGYERKMY